jgi:urease alpha subunit
VYIHTHNPPPPTYTHNETHTVEKDLTGPKGDECKFGGGKVIREGMGQATVRPCTQARKRVCCLFVFLFRYC